MITRAIFTALCFFAAALDAQIMLKLQGDSLLSYTYTGGDEFNAHQLNETDWKKGIEGTRIIMSQDLAFSPRNVVQKEGVIKFLALKEDSLYTMWYWEIDSNFLKREKMELKNNAFLTKYSAGAIVSRKKYHYGYYEIRFKVEEGRGIWPAFWFFGGEKNEEIDGFELKGEKNNQIHVDTHCPSGCDRGYKNNLGFNTNWGGWLPVTKQLHEGFNVMGLEWKQDELIWYLNGFPLAYFKGRFPNPMNLYLNTSVAKDGGPFKPGPDETTVWPNTYTVDYLRIWQPVAANTRIPLQQNENYVCSTEPAYKNMAVTRRKRGYMYKKREFGKTEGLVYLSHPSPGQLTIDVLGRLREAGTTIRLTAKNTDQTFTNFDQQIVAPLGKDDRELTLTVSTKKRQYTCTILLAD